MFNEKLLLLISTLKSVWFIASRIWLNPRDWVHHKVNVMNSIFCNKTSEFSCYYLYLFQTKKGDVWMISNNLSNENVKLWLSSSPQFNQERAFKFNPITHSYLSPSTYRYYYTHQYTEGSMESSLIRTLVNEERVPSVFLKSQIYLFVFQR